MASAEGKLNVSELDFEKIKENLIGFMTNQAEFVGYNFTGSSFDVLLDILAYNTHYNAYYANMVANETVCIRVKEFPEWLSARI